MDITALKQDDLIPHIAARREIEPDRVLVKPFIFPGLSPKQSQESLISTEDFGIHMNPVWPWRSMEASVLEFLHGG